VRLDLVARTCARCDRAPHQHVVREDEVGGKVGSERADVARDIPLAVRARHVLEQDRLEPLVPVEHEHGQEPADLRPADLGPAEVELLRLRILAEDDDLVPGPAPLTRQRPRVLVRARSGKQVAVPEENPHGSSLFGRPGHVRGNLPDMALRAR
jgi:hypothetical protein